jgi:hypothetical protein
MAQWLISTPSRAGDGARRHSWRDPAWAETPMRRRMLVGAHRLGQLLALLVVVVALTGLGALDMQLQAQERQRIVSSRAFIRLVVACRHATVPTPTWQACEERVRRTWSAPPHDSHID